LTDLDLDLEHDLEHDLYNLICTSNVKKVVTVKSVTRKNLCKVVLGLYDTV